MLWFKFYFHCASQSHCYTLPYFETHENKIKPQHIHVQGTHTNCVTVGYFEYRKGSYYRNMPRLISTYKIKINVFLPEMLCVVVLVAENGEF